MELRSFLAYAEERGWVEHIDAPVDPRFELARLIYALDERAALFTHIGDWPGRVVAGVCSRREYLALALGIPVEGLLAALVRALRQPVAPERVTSAPCQELVSEGEDAVEAALARLPILTHLPGDGGAYVTAGVAIIRDPQAGPNAAFHRLMRVAPSSGRRAAFTARLVEGRHTHQAWQRAKGPLPMAMCIGTPLAVQLAASMSPPAGFDELSIANALCPTPTVRALGSELQIPANCELVLEGHLSQELGDEGPFLDLTRTRDFVRQQPYFVVERITQRHDAIYQALLPGGREHRLLMGMPREPTIYEAVSHVCSCTAVNVTPGGGNWLHAVVQIDKRSAEDGRAAIAAAFQGHSSLKHVVIVDRDVDPHSPEAVEWAIATRFQADRDLVVLKDQPSSSLDPSARHIPGEKARTAKLGLDATIHWDTPGGPARPQDYQVLEYEPLDPSRYQRSGSRA